MSTILVVMLGFALVSVLMLAGDKIQVRRLAPERRTAVDR